MINNSDVIMEPELYDIFNAHEHEDIGMYLSLFQQAEAVLELGVGTGRISIPLAEKGISIFGVDCSEEMLSCLKGKLEMLSSDVSSRINLIHQDFCRLDIENMFDFAFYPFCTFNYLLTVDEQVAALSSLKKHLTKGAQVVFDLMTIHTFPNLLYNAHHTQANTVTQGDYDISIATQSVFNQATQLFSQDRCFEYIKKNDVVFKKRVKMLNRIFFLGEFSLLLEKCGYEINKIYGGYNFSQYNSSSHSLVVIAMPK